MYAHVENDEECLRTLPAVFACDTIFEKIKNRFPHLGTAGERLSADDANEAAGIKSDSSSGQQREDAVGLKQVFESFGVFRCAQKLDCRAGSSECGQLHA